MFELDGDLEIENEAASIGGLCIEDVPELSAPEARSITRSARATSIGVRATPNHR
jgi:hypothetical protein